jgi:hypothetical protein
MKGSYSKILRNFIADINLNESVLIPSWPLLYEKVLKFPKNFEVITDFDFTVTKYKHLGSTVSTIEMVKVRYIIVFIAFR